MVTVIIYICMFAMFFIYLKNLNTYVNRNKVLNAMLMYNRYHWRDGDILTVDSVESYTSTLLRFWDWGYKNIVDEETYFKIKGLIK